MRKGIHFLTKRLDYESGVMISLKHLCKILNQVHIDHRLSFYEDDSELIKLITESPYSCINIHVPSFTDETLKEITDIHPNVVISIHSTMCNLQVEGNTLERMLKMGDGRYPSLRFTCPSACEVDGFQAVMKNEYLWLPNTFSYTVDSTQIIQETERKKQMVEPVKISLISAYRPLKNMHLQMAAVCMLAREYNVELHMVNSARRTPVYDNLLRMAHMTGQKVVMHPQMNNQELFALMGQMHIGLQVSLTETFSYVAIEHMIQGVPVIGSDSVPYAGERASYSNVNTIYKTLKRTIESPDVYEWYAQDARRRALRVEKTNREQAVNTIRELIRRTVK